MPPQNSEPNLTSNTVTTTEQKCAWYDPLCKVTPLSKYLALAIFVLLPFVGAYVGYQHGLQNKVTVHHSYAKAVENMPAQTQPTTISGASFTPAEYTFTYPSMAAKFAKPPQTVRYATDRNVEKMMSKNAIPFDYYDHYTELPNVLYGDQMAADVAALPYLFIVASTTDFMVFSAPLFKETEGTESGLYKYDIASKTLTAMQTSSRYHPFMTGGKVSPDSTKLAVVNNPWPPVGGLSAAGLQLGYINVLEDTYTPLKTLAMQETARFCLEEMGCGSELTWVSDTLLQVKVTSWTKCESQRFDAKDEGREAYDWNTCSGPAISTEILSIPVQ